MVAFGLVTSCGYQPARKILKGGISSIGDKDESEPDPDAPQSSADADSAPLMPCPQSTSLAGATYAAAEVPTAKSCAASGHAGADLGCVDELVFGKTSVELRFMGKSQSERIQLAYSLCGSALQLVVEPAEGQTVLQGLDVSPDGGQIVDRTTHKVFVRR
jgi:hypothetical protein